VAIEIYKRGQGKYTRSVTLLGGGVVGAAIARYVWKSLTGDVNVYLEYGIPLAIFVGVAAAVFWSINAHRSADFMIATEGEMKKVSWTNRREIIGGTKVVIATTLIMALLLLAVDLGFGFFFKWIGVLQVGGQG
jgi:preprotein translocase SecE subunit